MLRESEAALDELEKIEADETIYKSVGELLIKAKRDTVKTDLAEKKETFSLRVKTLERQEERIVKRAQELQNQIQAALGAEGAG